MIETIVASGLLLAAIHFAAMLSPGPTALIAVSVCCSGRCFTGGRRRPEIGLCDRDQCQSRFWPDSGRLS